MTSSVSWLNFLHLCLRVQSTEALSRYQLDSRGAREGVKN